MVHRIAATPITLTLDGSYLCACTHYLVFKEPETRPAISRDC